MRRFVSRSPIFSFALQGYFISNGINANCFLEELQKCEITTPVKTEKQFSPKGGTIKGKDYGDGAPNEKVVEELRRQTNLQRRIRDAEDELRIMSQELQRCEAQNSLADFQPSPSGKAYMSTAELIQEGSPQHLEAVDAEKKEFPVLPPQESTGNGVGRMIVSFVGCVSSTPILRTSPMEGEFAEFLAGYSFPILHTNCSDEPPRGSGTTCVRCYGATLRSFTLAHIHTGDTVHVLGHVLPPEMSEKALCNIIGVLPVGGNITVVLPAK